MEGLSLIPPTTPGRRGRRLGTRAEDRMKGVVFQLLEDVAQREHGHEAWHELLALAGGHDETWSPAEQSTLADLGHVHRTVDLDAQSALRRTGRRAIPLLANLHPQLFANADCTRTFLLALSGAVIVDVARGLIRWPAVDSDFRILPAPDGDFFLGYRSRTHPCVLVEGLIQGAADYFGEAVSVVQLKCTGRGDNRCLFWINFEQA
jgi:hypothetical protein